MGAALDDAAVFQHHDHIGVLYGGEAVGDDENGASLHQTVHAPLYHGFGMGVDAGGGFVEDHHRRIRYRRPGDGDELALTLAQFLAAAADDGIVALGQTGDKAVGVGQLRRGDDLFIGGVEAAVTDVVRHRAGKEEGILEHDAEGAAEIGLFDLVDVDAVVADFAVLNIVKAVDQVGNGGFPRPGGADKGHLLTGLGVEGNIVKHRLFRGVAEIHIEHPHIPGQRRVGQRAVVMGVLPRPYAVFAFGENAVFLFPADEGHIAVVFFGFFIHQGEDPLGPGQSHDDVVHLLGDLRHGVGHALAQLEEGGDDPQGETADAVQRQRPADDGQNHILQVADIAHDGH